MTTVGADTRTLLKSMAIAPTATISNICGVSQSIEPTYQNLFVKSNLSGEFTVINPYLVRDLKARDLWDPVMVNDLKYYDGSVQPINRIPDDLKALYASAFEVDPRWLVEAGSRRQKWIDQAQSLNLYMSEPSGKKLDNLYKLAWVRGLKTTYYLRSRPATRIAQTSAARARAWLACSSGALACANWVVVAVVAFFFLFYYPAAIRYEDTKLERIFGDEWREWSRGIPAMLPTRLKFRAHEDAEWNARQSFLRNGELAYTVFEIAAAVLLWYRAAV